MLGRLGFTGRLVTIVLLALLALWAIGVGLVLVSGTREQIAGRLYPLPEQAAAIDMQLMLALAVAGYRKAARQMFLLACVAGHATEDDAAVIKVFPRQELPSKSPA